MVTPKFHSCQPNYAKNIKITNNDRRFSDYVNSENAKQGQSWKLLHYKFGPDGARRRGDKFT